MNAADNKKSLTFGIPGIIVQIIGNVLVRTQEGNTMMVLLGAVVALAGTVLLIVGLSFYARGKGYHPAFGLLGLLSCLGLIILAVMPDKNKAAG